MAPPCPVLHPRAASSCGTCRGWKTSTPASWFRGHRRGELDQPRGRVFIVFLTRDPREHHQIIPRAPPRRAALQPITRISFAPWETSPAAGDVSRPPGRGGHEVSPVVARQRALGVLQGPRGQPARALHRHALVCRPSRCVIPMDMSLYDKALWEWAENSARALPGYRPVGRLARGPGERLQQ